MNSAVLFGLTGISGVCWVAFRRWMRRYSVVLPPSPPGDPIIGHARFIPLSHTWIKFSKWCKIYGEIFYVHVLGRPIVVVSSFTAARELMEKRGKNYSDRPHLVMHPELFVIILRFAGFYWLHYQNGLEEDNGVLITQRRIASSTPLCSGDSYITKRHGVSPTDYDPRTHTLG